MTDQKDNEFIIRRMLSDAKQYAAKQLFVDTHDRPTSHTAERHKARIELLEYLKEQYLQGGNKSEDL